jgi:hypothetical protein
MGRIACSRSHTPQDGAHAELTNDADAAALSKEASVRFGRLWMPLPCVTARPRASSLEGVPSHDECDGTRRARAGTRTAVR